MKYLILIYRKNMKKKKKKKKKNIITLSSADLAQRVVKVKTTNYKLLIHEFGLQ